MSGNRPVLVGRDLTSLDESLDLACNSCSNRELFEQYSEKPKQFYTDECRSFIDLAANQGILVECGLAASLIIKSAMEERELQRGAV